MTLKLVVIGGVAGGASAAAKARRENEQAEIHIFERGDYISFANCGLPYYIGGEISDRDSLLVATPELFENRHNVRVHLGQEVLAIDPHQKTITVRNRSGEVRQESYDKLILSQGAEPLRPPIKGIAGAHVFTLRNIPDMDKIADFIKNRQPKNAVVIGGGYIGLEMAEAFYHHGLFVTVVEKMPHVMPLFDADIATEFQGRVVRSDFQLKCGSEVVEIKSGSVVCADGQEIVADIVLLSIGVRPELVLAREAGLEIGVTGGVKTDERMRSSVPDIFVAGDMAEVKHAVSGLPSRIPLAGPANRQAKVAAINAVGGEAVYKGSTGTAILRLFETAVGMSGLSAIQAEAAGFQVFSSMTRDLNHVGYYPGAETIITKMVVEKESGRILGAQVMGGVGVDRRIDVLALAIASGLSVEDLQTVDFAYSPPFGAPNDAVNMAARVAGNIRSGRVRGLSSDSWRPDGTEFILDIRNYEELLAYGKLKGSVHITLEKLRHNLSTLPRDRRIVVVCEKGLRGYIAARILMQNGFNQVYNLMGGFRQAFFNGLEMEKVV
jgi:NADPH-dependent 2,4-dienoyl-CoA reductase/sulfur reductase-like enzyme/rhodanese-related sulfurtransferase